jgi:hypothetical protein
LPIKPPRNLSVTDTPCATNSIPMTNPVPATCSPAYVPKNFQVSAMHFYSPNLGRTPTGHPVFSKGLQFSFFRFRILFY